ncbi:hypothetical protein CCMSSC00406_0003276 [Pleurotus cornucopiae]|uniref:Uncharacterized protein n=1 Tax=Pleurotus cornucopiae TaxID=5321 RepID=A0ACB7J7B4_PLECO|nr:hypothetical protein CCMSSC00406_0003276 [Pleurotus cornucopiae]
MVFIFVAPVFLLIAFILLLLVSVSVPVVYTINLFGIGVNTGGRFANAGVNGYVTFGVWGYCIDRMNMQFGGFNRGLYGDCSHPGVGYYFDPWVANALRVNPFYFENTISHSVTSALVMHVLAAILTFFTMAISVFMVVKRGSAGTARAPSLCTLILGVLAGLFTTVCFLIDVIFVAVVRDRIRDLSNDVLYVEYGNGVWMTLVAAILIWIGMVGACCGIFSCGGSRRFRKSQPVEAS